MAKLRCRTLPNWLAPISLSHTVDSQQLYVHSNAGFVLSKRRICQGLPELIAAFARCKRSSVVF